MIAGRPGEAEPDDRVALRRQDPEEDADADRLLADSPALAEPVVRLGVLADEAPPDEAPPDDELLELEPPFAGLVSPPELEPPPLAGG